MRPLFLSIREGVCFLHYNLLAMTVYYPGYTYLFSSSDDDIPYYRPLKKDYIRSVLQDLHDTAHHVYVCILNLPESRYAIVRYHDYVRRKIKEDFNPDNDSFTIDGFHRHYELFHPEDRFRIRFYTEVFYYEQGFTPYILEILYKQYLKYLCERGLRENKPIRLTPKLIRKYGLTKSDAKTVRKYLDRYTANLVEDIRLEYSAMTNLDCIKNEGK